MKRNELEHSDFTTYGVAFIALVAAVVICFVLFNK
jgi:Flp pilus assembly protein protease CpaA